MITYGTPDADLTAFNKLMEVVKDRQVMYIMHYPRVDMHARACQWPGSLKVQAVLTDLTVITVRQLKPGGPARVEK